MSVGTRGMSDERDPISFWNVCLCPGVDRDKYIQQCYLTGTVTITNENGEIQNNVRIGKIGLQLVDFPDSPLPEEDSLGSPVACIKNPYTAQLNIVEVYYSKQQYAYQKENQYVLYKNDGIGTAGIVIDGKGNISITVDGEEEQGNVTLSVTNQKRKGNLILIVNGDILLENDGNTTLKSNKIQLNESDEPILLGNKTVQLISDLLDQLAKESAGPYPLLGQTKYTELKQNIEKLKSKLSFVK